MARAAAALIRASAWMSVGGSGRPLIGKLSTARWVWARHRASAGTSTLAHGVVLGAEIGAHAAEATRTSGRSGAGGVEPVVLVAVLQADGVVALLDVAEDRAQGRRRGPASARRTRPRARPPASSRSRTARRNGSSYRAALAWWTSWPGPLSTSSSTTSYVAGRPRRRRGRCRRRRREHGCRRAAGGPWGIVPSRIHSTRAGSISTTSTCSTRRSPSTRSRVKPSPSPPTSTRRGSSTTARAASASACSEACSAVSITKTPLARSSSTVGPPDSCPPGRCGARAARARRARSRSVPPRRTPRIYRRRRPARRGTWCGDVKWSKTVDNGNRGAAPKRGGDPCRTSDRRPAWS